MPDTDLLEMMKDCFSPLIKSFNQNTEDIKLIKERSENQIASFNRRIDKVNARCEDLDKRVIELDRSSRMNDDILHNAIVALQQQNEYSQENCNGKYDIYKKAFDKLNRINQVFIKRQYEVENNPVSTHPSINSAFFSRVADILVEPD